MADIYYGTIPDEETEKRNRAWQSIRNFWSGMMPGWRSDDEIKKAIGNRLEVKPFGPFFQGMQSNAEVAHPPVYEGRITAPPPEMQPNQIQPPMPQQQAPPQMPMQPPPQMAQQPPQGQGQSIQDAINQFAAQRQAKQAQMYQLINAVMGQGQAQPQEMSRKEKIQNILLPLSATLSQFGGAMMTPPYARGAAMANLGAPLMEFAAQRQRKELAANKAAENRDLRMIALLPHLMKMQEGGSGKEHLLMDKSGNVLGVSPYPVSSVGQAEKQPGSYQAAAVAAYQQGNTELGNWYSQKAMEQATAGPRYTAGLSGYAYNPEEDQLTITPPRTKIYHTPKQGAGSGGGLMGAIGLGQQQGAGGTWQEGGAMYRINPQTGKRQRWVPE